MKVTVSFNNIPEKLIVPLAAITIFADPSVNFALQFQPLGEDGGYDDDPDGIAEAIAELAGENEKSSKPKEKGEVVSLDQFRKKD